MNSPYKGNVIKVKIIKSFRTIITYVLIFSLFWQNFLWAGGFHILQEDLHAAEARTYGGRRIGLVDPGTIRDREIHNVFADLQLLEEGGLIFKGAPETTKIYNRIYNADPIQLSGVIEADFPLPMVFANPGGIVLVNPDFQNIHDLTLAAGALAQTDKGMAYGVERGTLHINKTFVHENNGLKSLSLAGRGIHVCQSVLSPAKSLVLRAGQHIKGWNNQEEWISDDDLPKDPSLAKDSIILDEVTVLRSKNLFLESLEEGTTVQAKGLIHSIKGDIIIRARGDIYINKLFAHRHLKIKTTGKVFLGDQAFVGGAVKIKAAEIINQGVLISRGNITLPGLCRNEGIIKGHGVVDAKNFINTARGRLEAKSIMEPLVLLGSNLGNIEVQNDVKFMASAETLKGTFKTLGKIEIGGEELTLEGNVCAQKGWVFKDLKKLNNKQNSILSAFGAGFHGKLNELENEGKIDLSSANAWIGRSTNKKAGVIRTRGHSILQGDHHFNYGTIFTCGIHRTVLTGTYKDVGTFYSPTVLLLDAQEINYADAHKSFLKDGVISARSLLNAGNKVCFELKGNLNSCFLQLNSKQNLRFNGAIRQVSSSSESFPILDYFKIFNQLPFSPENFKNEITLLSLKSWEKVRPTFGFAITLQAGGDMNYEAAVVSQESGSVNFFAKNKVCTKNSNIKAGYFNGDSASIKCNMAVLNDTKLTSLFGNTSLIAQEVASLNNSHIHGGLSTQVNSQNLCMDRCEVNSTHGLVGVHGTQVININNSYIQANSVASVVGGESAIVNNSYIQGNSIVSITGEKGAIINQSTLKGHSTVVDGGKRLTLSQSHVEGLYNSFKAKHINADFNSIKGSTVFSGGYSLEIHNLNANGAVSAFAPISAFSGTSTAESLQIKSELIEQLGTIKTAKNTHMEARKAYIDTPESLTEAGGRLSLIAEETTGFKGYQKAGETLDIVLKDMNLLDLLNQSEARLTKANLRESELNFNKDFILDRTLHVWARSLQNKAIFTATGDFIAHMHTLIMNEGSMLVSGNLGLESQGTFANFGLMEGARVDVKGKTIVHESLVSRNAISGGYRDGLSNEAIMRACTGNLNVEATELFHARGSKFEAKLNIDLKSAGKLYIGAQQLSSDIRHSGKRSSYHCYTLFNHKSQINAGKNVNIWSDEGMVFEGVDVTAAGYIRAKSESTLENKAVHNIVQEENRITSKGGLFKSKKTTSTQTSTNTVVRNIFKAGEDIRLEAEEDNIQQAPYLESSGSTSIISNQGKVAIKADKSSYVTSTQKSSKSVVWQSQQQKGRYDETIEMLEILAKGGIHISGAKGVEVDIRQDHTLVHSLDILEKHAETAWVKELRNNPKVTWHLIAEEHKKWNQKAQGLTGPAAAVIALAIAIATQGTGAALISGLTANATIGAMASAGFTSLVSQASISLINNQGNIDKVFKDLGSQENLKSLATSIASAGIVQGISSQFNLPAYSKTFTQHLQRNIITSGTSAGLSMLIHKQDAREALLQAAKGIAADTLGGVMANHIGKAYGQQDLNWAMHKLAHGALGAFTGAILGDDPAAGALAGALGGVVSEIIADGLLDDAKAKAFDQALEKASQEGRPLEYKDVHEAFSAESGKVANMGRLGAAFAAFGLEQDVNIATRTATNAVENNFIPLVMVGLSVASAIYSAYEVYSAYDKAGGGEEGAKAALEELGKQGLINLAGGAVGKVGTKAASAVLAKVLAENPTIALIFGKAAAHLGKVEAVMANTKVGQAANKIEASAEKLFGQAKDKLEQIITKKPTLSNQDVGIRWGGGIQGQGMPWEEFLAKSMPGTRLPQNFKTFDFYDELTRVATSAKTLNTNTASKIADPTKVYSSLKKNIDQASGFAEHTLCGMRLTSDQIASRELHVAIPKTTTVDQWTQIKKAIDYGRNNGVNVKITEIKY